MDDTLLNRDCKISERNAAAIKKAVAEGIIFLIATGRMYVSARPYALDLGLDMPLVTYNGALVKESRSGKVFYEHKMNLETARDILKYCKEKGCYLQVYIGDKILIKEENDFSRMYTKISGIPTTEVGEAIYTADEAPYKILVMTAGDHGDNPDDRNFIDAWSWVLFGGVFVGSWRKVNPILLIVLSAGAGILIYYVF